jgi:hypothetical protein
MRAAPPIAGLRGRLPGAALALLLVLGGAGCASVTGPLDEERDRLEQARAQWRSQGMTSYAYVYRRSCFCAPGSTEPMTITVRNNAIQSVVRISDGERQDPALFDTVDGLFELLGDALDGDPAQFRADYDAGRGYPTSAYIDRDSRIADEELGFTATDLQPLR